MIIIGLSGKIGTGKTCLGRELVSRIDNGVRLSFASALKHEVAELYGFDVQLCHSAAGKATMIRHEDLPAGFCSVRQILIDHGRRRRMENPEYWVEKLARILDVLGQAGVNMAVIDDMRYPNEAGMLRGRDAWLVRVEPYATWKPGAFADDPSECMLDMGVGWDLVVKPDFGPVGLRCAANQIMCSMMLRGRCDAVGM